MLWFEITTIVYRGYGFHIDTLFVMWYFDSKKISKLYFNVRIYHNYTSNGKFLFLILIEHKLKFSIHLSYPYFYFLINIDLISIFNID